MDTEPSDAPPRALLVAAVVIAVAAVVVILVVAVTRQRTAPQQPVPLVTIPAPAATGAECTKLNDELPDELGDAVRAPLAEPAPAGAAAWRPDVGGEAIVLRCGVERPSEFVVGAPLQGVDDVQWFRVVDDGAQRSTWYAVDRGVYVALTLPQGSGPTAIQQISGAIAAALPARPLDPAPAR